MVKTRAAFTFIELIFAIVIIAITVISLPTLSNTTSEGIERNLVQEAVFAAATELNQAVTANWDERSLEDGGIASLARVIDDGSCENNSTNFRYRLKNGHIAEPYHRRCLDSNTSTGLGATTSAINALEDFAGTQTLVNTGASQSGYKYSYSTLITVSTSASFGVLVNNINIKRIDANITDTTTAQLLVSLRTYSCNVGEVDYYKRTY
ncbi:MAG: hypothetical protein JXQ67_03460 [Campylobacterales bacterium]|nr:hypothetical protein [Campylobacterales bacterium]